MRQKTAKNQWNCIVLNFNQIKASLFQYKFKCIFPTKSTLLPFTFNHKSFLFISFMSNRKYSYIFSQVLSSGNNSSQTLTGLYNFKIFNISPGNLRKISGQPTTNCNRSNSNGFVLRTTSRITEKKSRKI